MSFLPLPKKTKRFLYRVIVILLIPALLLSNAAHAWIPPDDTNSIVPYYISELVDENKADLGRLTRAVTPVRGRTIEDRAREFGKAWVVKSAQILAKKMVAKIKKLEGKITLEDAEKELLRQIRAWSRKHDVPRYRKDKLIAAVKREFAKARRPNVRQYKYRATSAADAMRGLSFRHAIMATRADIPIRLRASSRGRDEQPDLVELATVHKLLAGEIDSDVFDRFRYLAEDYIRLRNAPPGTETVLLAGIQIPWPDRIEERRRVFLQAVNGIFLHYLGRDDLLVHSIAGLRAGGRGHHYVVHVALDEILRLAIASMPAVEPSLESLTYHALIAAPDIPNCARLLVAHAIRSNVFSPPQILEAMVGGGNALRNELEKFVSTELPEPYDRLMKSEDGHTGASLPAQLPDETIMAFQGFRYLRFDVHANDCLDRLLAEYVFKAGTDPNQKALALYEFIRDIEARAVDSESPLSQHMTAIPRSLFRTLISRYKQALGVVPAETASIPMEDFPGEQLPLDAGRVRQVYARILGSLVVAIMQAGFDRQTIVESLLSNRCWDLFENDAEFYRLLLERGFTSGDIIPPLHGQIVYWQRRGLFDGTMFFSQAWPRRMGPLLEGGFPLPEIVEASFALPEVEQKLEAIFNTIYYLTFNFSPIFLTGASKRLTMQDISPEVMRSLEDHGVLADFKAWLSGNISTRTAELPGVADIDISNPQTFAVQSYEAEEKEKLRDVPWWLDWHGPVPEKAGGGRDRTMPIATKASRVDFPNVSLIITRGPGLNPYVTPGYALEFRVLIVPKTQKANTAIRNKMTYLPLVAEEVTTGKKYSGRLTCGLNPPLDQPDLQAIVGSFEQMGAEGMWVLQGTVQTDMPFEETFDQEFFVSLPEEALQVGTDDSPDGGTEQTPRQSPRGKHELSEREAAKAFRRFAAFCRKQIRLIEQHVESEKFDKIKGYLDLIRNRIIKEFGMSPLGEVVGDIIPSCFAFIIFKPRGEPYRDAAQKVIDAIEKNLVEFEKLMSAGRLLDAEKAIVGSDRFDASLVLGEGALHRGKPADDQSGQTPRQSARGRGTPYNDAYSCARYIIGLGSDRQLSRQVAQDFLKYLDTARRARGMVEGLGRPTIKRARANLRRGRPISDSLKQKLRAIAATIIAKCHDRFGPAKGILALDDALKIDPQSHDLRTAYDGAYRKLGEKTTGDFIATCEEILRQRPFHENAATQLAERFLKLNRHDSAVTVLESAIGAAEIAQFPLKERVLARLRAAKDRMLKAKRTLERDARPKFDGQRRVVKVVVPDGEGGYFVDTLGFDGNWEVNLATERRIENGAFMRILKSLSIVVSEVGRGEVPVAPELAIDPSRLEFGQVVVIDDTSDVDIALNNGAAAFEVVHEDGRYKTTAYVTRNFLYRDRHEQRDLLRKVVSGEEPGLIIAEERAFESTLPPEEEEGAEDVKFLMIHSDPTTYYGAQVVSESLRASGISTATRYIADWNLSGNYMEELTSIQEFGGQGPNVVGISICDYDIEKANTIIREVRERLPDAFIIIGGPATKNPEQIATFITDFDFMVRGEVEEILPKIIRIIGGRPRRRRLTRSQLREIQALDGGIIAKTERRVIVNRLSWTNEVAAPHLPKPKTKALKYYWFTSRGCPMNCAFCDIPMGRTYRTVPADEMLGWLIERLALEFDDEEDRQRFIAQVGRGERPQIPDFDQKIHIAIQDDDFLARTNNIFGESNTERVKHFLREVIRLGLNDYFEFSVRATRVDSFYEDKRKGIIDIELVDLMWDAGFGIIILGTDGPSQAILDQNRKGYSLEQHVIPLNRLLCAKGFTVYHNVIYFTTHTTYREAVESLILSEVCPLQHSSSINTGIIAGIGTDFTNYAVVNNPNLYRWDAPVVQDLGHYVLQRGYRVPKNFKEYALADSETIPHADPKTFDMASQLVQGASAVDVLGDVAEEDIWRTVRRWQSIPDETSELRALGEIFDYYRRHGERNALATIKRVKEEMVYAQIHTFTEYLAVITTSGISQNPAFRWLSEHLESARLAYADESRWEEAEQAFKEIVAHRPDIWEAYASLINILSTGGRCAEAWEYFARLTLVCMDIDYAKPLEEKILRRMNLKEVFDRNLTIFAYFAFQDGLFYQPWTYLIARVAETIGLERVNDYTVLVDTPFTLERFTSVVETFSIGKVKKVVEQSDIDIGTELNAGKTVEICGIPFRLREGGVIEIDLENLRPESTSCRLATPGEGDTPTSRRSSRGANRGPVLQPIGEVSPAEEAIRQSARGKTIDQSFTIGSGEEALLLPNRRLAQPMEHNNCPGGHISELTKECYESLAQLGLYGVMGIEATAVGPTRARHNQLRIGDEYVDDIVELVTHIRENSPFGENQIISVQPNHSGSISDPRFSEVVRTYPPREGDPDSTPGRLLVNEDVEPIIESFVNAAIIAYRAGINIVDIKCCHGYLLGQFLRPANEERDNWDWGGSFDNRVRVVEEIIRRIRKRIPDKKFKIMTRISLYEGDNMPGGIGCKGPNTTEMDLEEPIEMIKRFVAAGAQIINVSAGIPKFNADQWGRPIVKPVSVTEQGRLLSFHHIVFSKNVKDALIADDREDVVVVGSGFSVFQEDREVVAEEVLRRGYADIAGFGRQTIAGEQTCKLCSGCSRLLVAQAPVGCTRYGKLYKLLDTARRRIRYAASRDRFEDELANIDDEMNQMPQLEADSEIVRYVRAFISKQVLLGYLDVATEIIEKTQELISHPERGLKRSSLERVTDGLTHIEDAASSFQRRASDNPDFNGLKVIVNDVMVTLTSRLRSKLSQLIEAGEIEEAGMGSIAGLLARIRKVMNVYQTWSLYPQFYPSMVERIDESTLGGVRLSDEAHTLGVPTAESIAEAEATHRASPSGRQSARETDRGPVLQPIGEVSPAEETTRQSARGALRKFGKTGLEFYVLGVGTVWFGRRWPPDNSSYTYPDTDEIGGYLDKAFERMANRDGVVMIDTAAAYGLSEERLGQCLREKGLLPRAFIATKWGEEFDIEREASTPDHSKDRLISSVERSFSRLGKIDLLYIHGANLNVLRDRDVMDEMQRMKREGHCGIRYLGASVGAREDVLETAVKENLIDELDVIQMPAFLFLKRPDLMDQINRKGIAIVLNSPVRKLTDRTPEDMYAELLEHEDMAMILTGTRHHPDETIGYARAAANRRSMRGAEPSVPVRLIGPGTTIYDRWIEPGVNESRGREQQEANLRLILNPKLFRYPVKPGGLILNLGSGTVPIGLKGYNVVNIDFPSSDVGNPYDTPEQVASMRGLRYVNANLLTLNRDLGRAETFEKADMVIWYDMVFFVRDYSEKALIYKDEQWGLSDEERRLLSDAEAIKERRGEYTLRQSLREAWDVISDGGLFVVAGRLSGGFPKCRISSVLEAILDMGLDIEDIHIVGKDTKDPDPAAIIIRKKQDKQTRRSARGTMDERAAVEVTREAPQAVIDDLRDVSRQLTAHTLLEFSAAIDISNIAIVMRKGLTEDHAGGKGVFLGETLKQRYKLMKQNLERKTGRKIVEVAPQDNEEATRQTLTGEVERLIGLGLKVIVLDDGELTKGLTESDIKKARAGEDYCVVTAPLEELDATTIHFLNLNAMVLMGVGILHNRIPLFELAYRMFKGEDAPEELIDKLAKKTLWIVNALPRIVRFSADDLRNQIELQKLFRVAA